MSISEIEYTKETKYLDNVVKRIKYELESNSNVVDNAKGTVYELKKYFWENRQDIDGAERASINVMIEQDVDKGDRSIKRVEILEKVIKSPYFGKIVFFDDGFEELINVYIGLTSVKDEGEVDFLVYDWRSPIASMYYEFSVGKANYDAPIGSVKGEIRLKRQYKIEEGKIKFIFDNDINIEDELLKEALSKNTSDKMRNIVNSIQQEQNQVIRNDKNDVLVVQGPAGSGKTSVALHRIAYLLYKERKYINSNNILIFSPSDVFSDYISNVLPELGEENVLQTTFIYYAKQFIDEYDNVEGFIQQLKKIYEDKDDIDYRKLSIKVKTDIRFKDVLDKYLIYLENKIQFKDLNIDGKTIVSKSEFKNMFEIEYKHLNLKKRVDKIIDRTLMLFDDGTLNKQKMKKYRNEIKSQINIDFNMKRIYMGLFNNEEMVDVVKKIFDDDNVVSMCRNSKKFLRGNFINYEDAICLLYLKGRIEGFYKSENIKYVVIDEAQDYSVLQYDILKKIFKEAKFTILGDVSQAINPYMDYRNFSSVVNIFNNNNPVMIELFNCYRSSYEINMFANNLLNLKNLNPIKRKEGLPEVIKGFSQGELLDIIVSDLESMLKKDYKQIAVICKYSKDILKVYDFLKDKFNNISYIEKEADVYEKGIVVIPAYLTKGLEFDGVLIYCTQNSIYFDEIEKKLLYVVFTRALHELKIYSESENLGLIDRVNNELYQLRTYVK